MKKIYILSIFIVSIIFNAPAQTVNIGGQCMSGSITLPYLQDVAGKNAYVGSGTVMGISDVSIAVYWIGAPDNVWVIAFEGQPYFFSTCNTDIPPGTANPSCSWTAVGGTSCTGAQPLSVTGNVVLPVGLTDFSATAHDQKSILEWHTAQEQNNRGFYVERSPDGTNWTVIGFVAGAGNSNTPKAYSFTDVAPAKGNNFYRLRQEDIDNRQKFSAIAKVSFSNATDIIVTNNPGNGLYEVRMAAGTEKVEILVRDVQGRLLQKNISVAGNTTVNLTNQPAGVYWMQIRSADNIFNTKLIKR